MSTPEVGLQLWDIAAGWLLCEEAGLGVSVEMLDGHRFALRTPTSGFPD